MSKPVFFNKNSHNQLEIYIAAIPDWDGFEKLIQFFMQEYDVVVLKQYDGPYVRRWILVSDGKQFELQHEDTFGNYLIATTAESEELVKKIGKDLEERLKDLED